MEPPPGGPEDRVPPSLLATRPDSIRVLPGFDGPVEFRFNEVISEGSQASQGLGTSDLERLIILSPTTNVPKISWKRNAITVEPKEGWRPNRVYRVELRPGIMDLQRNRLDSGAVVTFSTGAPLPSATLTGTVIDWAAGRPAVLGMVEAMLLPDSLPYRGLTDSSGVFALGPLPRGQYLVYGVIDQNRNLRREFRDSYDTVRVGPDSFTAAVLWAAPRDTAGPRLQTVTVRDSLSAELTFNQPVDPYQPIDTSNVRVLLLPDSSTIPVTSLLPHTRDDSLQSALRRAADTARAADTSANAQALDSARAAAQDRLKPGPARQVSDSVRALLVTRPALSDRLLLRVGVQLEPGKRYLVETRGIRNVNRIPADSRLPLTVPQRPPPPARDSTAAEPDSLEPDTTGVPPLPQ